ncbi:MAG: RNA polymerase subunit sigma-70 [Selenomonadaceae bacterium]|nr:RNA polymerase subunit sigma-70 [Selenomonadaceae bacterium]
MTSIEKLKICDLMRQGCGYTKISQELGIPANTVKSFIQRNKSEICQTKKVCLQCGQAIAQLSASREKKFCSDACRMKWWNKHTQEMKANAVCQHCGKSFHGRAGRKFCSHACYIAERFGGKDVS